MRRVSSCPATLSAERLSTRSSAAAPVESAFSWPPSVEWANLHGVKAVGLLAIPACLATFLASRTGQASDNQKNWSDEELKRRERRLAELIGRADASLHRSEVESTAVRVRARDVLEACQAVAQLSPGHKDCARGLLLTSHLLEQELLEVTRKTADREDESFRDGEELSELLRNFEQFRLCCSRCHLTRADRVDINRRLREVRLVASTAEHVRRVLRNQDLTKALRLIWTVRMHLPLIMVSSLLAAATGVLRTAEMFYRAESLEVFRNPTWTWGSFRHTTWALVLTKMITILTDIVRERIHTLGETRMANTLRVQMYECLLHKDLEWYRIGEKDQRNVDMLLSEIYCLPGDVQSLLAIPRQLMTDAANILSQVAIVRQRSSALLYALLAIQWTNSALQAGLVSLRDWIIESLREANPKPTMKTFEEPLLAQNLTMIKSFAYEGKAVTNWMAYWENDSALDQNVSAVREAFRPLANGLQETAGFAERGWCGQLIKDGRMQVGAMQNLQTYAQEVSGSLEKVPQRLQSTREKLRPLAKAWDVLEAIPKVQVGVGTIPLNGAGKPMSAIGAIRFEHVRFAYPDGSTVLRNVDFAVAAGHTVGITGTSGGGKSTLFKLMHRFYDVDQGRITLDGKDIRDYDVHWLRRQIAVVPQSPRLLTLTLWENLTIGCMHEPTEIEVEFACRAAHIWEELVCSDERLPNGLYTHVTADKFSGGELQRLAIARALLQNAPVILLDEATSALDYAIQQRVQVALANLVPRRTVLTIAHRLETIRDADKIVCLHGGVVAEEGAHESLIDRLVQVSVLYPSLHAFHVDVVAQDTAAGRIVTRVHKGGSADLAGVRPGFAVEFAGSQISEVSVGFRGPGVYAELCRQPGASSDTSSEAVSSAAEQDMHPAGLQEESSAAVLEKLQRAEEELENARLRSELGGVDMKVEQHPVYAAMQDLRLAIGRLAAQAQHTQASGAPAVRRSRL